MTDNPKTVRVRLDDPASIARHVMQGDVDIDPWMPGEVHEVPEADAKVLLLSPIFVEDGKSKPKAKVAS